MERPVLRYWIIRDTVHTVYVFSIKMNVLFRDLPGVVFLYHRHPPGITGCRNAATVDITRMQQGIAPVQLFRRNDRPADKMERIRMYFPVAGVGR